MSAIEAKDVLLGVGILVTLFLGIWNAVAHARSTRRASFINTVTNQRVKWIEQLRQDIAAFSGLTYTWCFSSLEGKPQEYDVLKEIDRLRHVIKLRLNPLGGSDQQIARLIDDIPKLTDKTQHEKLLRSLGELTEASQSLLKEEWEKVKAESHAGEFSGRRRLAIVLSGAWLALLFPMLEGNPFLWHKLFGGLVLLALPWAVWWVWTGFSRPKRRDT